MSRPENITNEDITRWLEKINNDPFMSEGLKQNSIIMEVCYAGQWLVEKLDELKCPDNLIGRIIYTAGKVSFGRDPWTVHQNILEQYISGTLDYEMESLEVN